MRGIAIVLLLTLAGCAPGAHWVTPDQPVRQRDTEVGRWLREAAPPAQPVDVSIYRFGDLTGQYKPSETQFSYSRAISQGADVLLMGALRKAGSGQWFHVLDRTQLEDLLKERQIIREMRTLYGGDTKDALPPLRYAGVLMTGGVIGYDSNLRTAGGGLRIVGIGASTEVRHDVVTVSLSALSTQTGEVLHTVVAQKGVFSVKSQSGAFRYIDDNSLLEFEAGAAYNEPVLIALQRAIELAVYALMVEGSAMRLWAFSSEEQSEAEQASYRRRLGIALETVTAARATPTEEPPP